MNLARGARLGAPLGLWHADRPIFEHCYHPRGLLTRVLRPPFGGARGGSKL